MTAPAATAAQDSGAANPRAYGGAAIFILALVMGLSFVFGSGNTHGRFTPDKWLNQDGTFYFLTLRTLVDHHTLIQDQTQPRSWYEQDLGWNRNLPADWSDVAVGRGGHWYPKHPILLPVATVPFFYAFGAYGALILNLLCLALLPVLGYRIALRFAPWGAALAAAAVFAASAYRSGPAYGYSNDLFYAVLVLLAFERAFAGKPIGSGIWFSLAVFAKATNAMLLIPLALIYLLRRDGRGLMRFAIASAPGILLFAGLNTWMYGAAWHTGYNHILVRENGQMAFHDHAHDFDWAHWWTWVKARLVAPSGTNTFNMWDRAAFWFLALPGALVAFVRVPKLAVPLVLGVAAPVLLLAPFQYFRVEFLDASVALSVPLIAALLIPWVKAPKVQPAPVPKLRWDRLGPALAVVILLAASGVRAAVTRHGGYFEQHLEAAHVSLVAGARSVPCDYFNWQEQRWECSHFEGGDAAMTGRSLVRLPRFDGKPFRGISMAPSATRAVRRIAFSGVPMKGHLEIRYGFPDALGPRGHESFRVLINGQPTDLPLGAQGQLQTTSVDTSALAGKAAEVDFEIASDAGADAPVVFDGDPK